MSLSVSIKKKAKELGFDACGIAEVSSADTEALFFDRWIAEGCHAGMKYMENYRDIRLNPAGLVEGARSVISVALNYYPAQKQSPDAPRISYYAYGKDYHIVLKDKLRQLWQYITEELLPSIELAPEARAFTDSAPLLERYWAWKAGLGWIGKNCLLVTPQYGSAVRISSLLTDAPLTCDAPITRSQCGACHACVRYCPAHALKNTLWRPGMPREDIVSVSACYKKQRQIMRKSTGIDTDLCGKCFAVCTYTKQYLKQKQNIISQ